MRALVAGALLGSAGGCSSGVPGGAGGLARQHAEPRAGRQCVALVFPRAGGSRAGGQPQRGGRGARGFLQEPNPVVPGGGPSLRAGLLRRSREGQVRWGRGEGSSQKSSQLLLLPPGQRFHCGGKKQRRWVSHGFKAASSPLPVLVLPAESARPASRLSHAAQCNTSPLAFRSTDKETRKTCSCR